MTKPIFYGGKLSYFSGKGRAYLNYKQVDYEERLSTAEIYKSVIIPRIGYPMIPVTIMSDDTVIQDTTELIDYFEAKIPERSVVPQGPRQRFVSSLLELYGDEWLVIPAMHYRWAHNRDFAIAEFGTIAAAGASKEEQYKAGEQASKRFEGAVPLLGVTSDMAPAVEASYVALLHELNTHFEIHDFVLGGRPCAGDFGLIGPLYAHLYRDPASGALMKKEGPAVARWVERMIAEPFVADGDFVAGDEIPQTLIPILKRQMREQGPCLLDIFERVSAFKKDNPEADIPRAVGMHSFTIEDKTGNRVVLPYTQWLAQRAFEPVGFLEEAHKDDVNMLLRDIGGEAFIDVSFDAPVTRDNHQLVWR